MLYATNVHLSIHISNITHICSIQLTELQWIVQYYGVIQSAVCLIILVQHGEPVSKVRKCYKRLLREIRPNHPEMSGTIILLTNRRIAYEQPAMCSTMIHQTINN